MLSVYNLLEKSMDTSTATTGIACQYKNSWFLVVGTNGNKLTIMNPSVDSKKLNVLPSNTSKHTKVPCYKVSYKGNDYVVTAKKFIISCNTKRVMKWLDCDKHRKDILALCGL